MKYTVCVIRTSNITAFLARMKLLSFSVLDALNDEGRQRQFGQRLAIPCTLSFTQIISGDFVFEFRMTDEEMATLPRNDTPNFTVVWTSEDVDAYELPIPKPLFDVEFTNYDDEGNPTGTRVEQCTAPELA